MSVLEKEHDNKPKELKNRRMLELEKEAENELLERKSSQIWYRYSDENYFIGCSISRLRLFIFLFCFLSQTFCQ